MLRARWEVYTLDDDDYTGQTTELTTNPDPFLTRSSYHKTPRDHPIDLFGDSCFRVDNSGARATGTTAYGASGCTSSVELDSAPLQKHNTSSTTTAKNP